MMFPETTFAWRQFKLLLAECIVLTLASGDHTNNYTTSVYDAADGIKAFRELYYPHKKG